MKKFYAVFLLLATAVCAVAQQEDTTTLTDSNTDSSVVISTNDERAQRGFTTNTNFVPKGQWIFGGTASYTTHRNSDYKLLVVDGINSTGYTVKISPMIAYAPWKNMAVGIRFGYGRSMLALDSASLAFGEGDSSININVDYYHQLKHTYTGSLFWRPYIPLGHSNRFAIFAEVQLNLSGSQSRLVAEDGVIDGYTNYRGSYAKSFGASIALQPGIMAFVTNNTALELSIGVFGIGYERTNQFRNQVETGIVESSNMNFKVNLLSVGFGVSFYL